MVERLTVEQLNSKPENRGFKSLEVWQLSKDLTATIYAVTENFPTKEQFGLTAQIRRAAISIISNIAEGSAKGSNADFARFIAIAQGSIAELEAQLIIANEIKYLDNKIFNELCQKITTIGKMLKGLKSSILRKTA
jgi:four helix bundle protein